MESFVDGSLDDSESGLLNAEAWRDINAWYGVDESQVESALASGKRSPEPVDFNVSSPKLSPCAGPRFTDYGTSVGKMAAATGLVLPRLTKLRGQRLSGLSGASGCVDAMSFGPSSTSGVPSTSVDVAARRPGDPDALVNTYKSMFASMPHRHAPVEYAAQASSIYFPYRSGEWVWIETSRSFTPNEAKHLVRAILSAPTAG